MSNKAILWYGIWLLLSLFWYIQIFLLPMYYSCLERPPFIAQTLLPLVLGWMYGEVGKQLVDINFRDFALKIVVGYPITCFQSIYFHYL